MQGKALCLNNIPNPTRIHAIHIDYLGRGTQTADVILLVTGFLAVVLIATLIAWKS